MTHVTANAPTGTPTWIDLGIPDLEAAKAFYGALFGWEFEDFGPESGHYNGCRLNGRQVAAIMQNPDPQETEFWWNVYFAADDCDGTAERITDAGGTLLMPPDDVMGQGRMAVAKDPAGGQFGLWQGMAHIGAETVNEPGSIVWNELVTPSAGKARDFYTAVFDQTLQEVPGMDYTALIRPDGRAIGGIEGSPDATSSSWTTYFEVADPDEAVRRVRDSGGTAGDPVDTPYGRIADVQDPFGVRFRVMRSAPPE